jgi:predicted nucleic acid-binding protein
VVDASVAAKWHLRDEEHTDRARHVLSRFAQGQIALFAPIHIRVEVPAVIVAATRRRPPRLSRQQGQEAIDEFLSLAIETVESPALTRAAYVLAHQHDLSFYDAIYLSAARALGAPLVTADRRFYERIRSLPNARWIGDYPPAI